MSTNRHNGQNGWRTDPMYSFGEAANLAHVSAGTVRNWLFGYSVRQRDVPPLFKTHDQGPMVSFLQLIEIVVAGRFRKAEGVSFQTVRRAYKFAQAEWGLAHPFAHLQLEVRGSHIVRELRHEKPGVSQQALDAPQQWTLPGLVLDMVHQLVYERGLAARWYPVGRTIPIVVDPRISSGVPTVEQRGVTIYEIHQRFKGRQGIDFIARDLKLDSTVIEEAVRYAEQVAT